MYPPAVVPRLDDAVFPRAFVDVVRDLLLCSARKRATVAAALAVIRAATPLGVGDAALAVSGGSSGLVHGSRIN